MHRKKTRSGSLNAYLLDLLEGYMDKVYGARKRSVFRKLPSEIVEIGPGAGANFRYFAPGTKLIAIEPNPSMHPYLVANAARYAIKIEVRGIFGEELDLPAESVEAVVGTLVLCSVETPARVTAEVYRILKPGGRYIFLEHIAAPQGSHLRAFQDLIHKPWHRLFDGCNLNRNTHSLLWNAGFSTVSMDCFMLRPRLAPMTPHIFGLAVK